METTVPYYRLYLLNRSSGHIDRVEEIDAADDVQAVAVARECERETAAELWQEGRKVLRLEVPTNLHAPNDLQMFRSAVSG
jgi:alpha-mannosidase